MGCGASAPAGTAAPLRGGGGQLPPHVKPPTEQEASQMTTTSYLGLHSTFVTLSPEAEQANAARDIQAVARGRKARHDVAALKTSSGTKAAEGQGNSATTPPANDEAPIMNGAAFPVHVNPPTDVDHESLDGYLGLHSTFVTLSPEAEQANAARDIQAVARGRKARHDVAALKAKKSSAGVQAEAGSPEGAGEAEGGGESSAPATDALATDAREPFVHPEFGQVA
eukprot:COSAG01_NODE_54_length_31327_cov_317.045356_19_plen_225_part_00